MTQHVVILGAGFGGLELAARLSESVVPEVRVSLIDQSDSFVFGFSKLDVLFGRRTRADVSCRYREISLPGVTFRQERVTAIDPRARNVETSAGSYDADFLAVALGADYDMAATPGFAEGGYEYYSVDGAERLKEALASFSGGSVIIAILGVPFKCPPAPYEGALMLHEYLVARGIRNDTTVRVISPMDSPVPVSRETSDAIVATLRERDIDYTPGARVRELDTGRSAAVLKAETVPYDLFIGIPVHRAPAVVRASGLTVGGNDGWVAVDPRNLATRFPNVFAFGDCADAPVPRAGVFAETAARVVADSIAGRIHGGDEPERYAGRGSCYIEFGDGLVGKVDADFLSGPAPKAPFLGPSPELALEKQQYAAARIRRWFGR